MRADHTVLTRSAVVAMTLTVTVQLLLLVGGVHDAYIDTLLAALVVAESVAALKLHRRNSFESRMSVALLATVCAGGVLLTATAGLPGGSVRPWDAPVALMLALATTVVALLAVDHARRDAEHRARSPYAL